MGVLTSDNLIVRRNGVAIHDSTSTSISLDPGVHVSLRTYGLANQCNAAVVDALSITIIEATAPFAITDKSWAVKKVTSGPPAHTNQVSK